MNEISVWNRRKHGHDEWNRESHEETLKLLDKWSPNLRKPNLKREGVPSRESLRQKES